MPFAPPSTCRISRMNDVSAFERDAVYVCILRPIKCDFVTCRLLVRHRAEFSHLEVVGIHIDYANRIGARN